MDWSVTMLFQFVGPRKGALPVFVVVLFNKRIGMYGAGFYLFVCCLTKGGGGGLTREAKMDIRRVPT